MNPLPFEVTCRVICALESLGVDYVVVGSMAVMVLGIPRSTIDSDLLVDLRAEHVPGLVADLQSEFYIDDLMALEAISRGSMFNVIHLESGFKVDLYILGQTPFQQQEFGRRQLVDLGGRAAYLVSPEDLVLSKLQWYQMGNQVSERQWKDLLGVLALWQGSLDGVYMQLWAGRLGLGDLLQRALAEAPAPSG